MTENMLSRLIWVLIGVAVLACTRISPKVHLVDVSVQTLANELIAVSLLCAFPFIAYSLLGKKSWTGMSLSTDEKQLIEGPPGHVVGAYLWLLLSALQLLTFKKYPVWHKRVGKIVLLGVLPACLLEISTNAVRVFVPSKPKYLAHVVLQKKDISLTEIAAFVQVFSVPLLLPVGVALHAYFAARSIWNKTDENRIRLHAHHLMCAVAWMLGPGQFRFITKALFTLEWGGCREHTGNPLDAIVVQTISFLLAETIILFFKNRIYMTLPPALKENAVVEGMRKFWIWVCMHQIIACAILGVDIVPNCQTEQ